MRLAPFFTASRKGEHRSEASGMTVVELALVVVIIGCVLALGGYSMITMLHNARLSKTRAILEQTRDCLIKRAVYNDRYPSYAATGVIDCTDLTYDVNACFCKKDGVVKDAWGQELRYLEGVNAGKGLGGQKIMDFSGSGNAVSPGEASKLINKAGKEEDDVAFVLISYGEGTDSTEGIAFHDSYGSRFPGTALAGHIAVGAPPDFRHKDNDDLYLLVTAGELRRTLAE